MSIKQFTLWIFFLFLTISLFSQQKFITRTAHIHVKSSNRVKDIEADNYQVASVLDTENGTIDFVGLLKSFEFKLGAADQLFNSSLVDVSAHPNIKFIGQIAEIRSIDFSRSGEYNITVNGTLYVWDEKRVTSTSGKLVVNPDGSLTATSKFNMVIEDKSVEKVNKLMKEKLPKAFAIDVETLGISKTVAISVKINYQSKNKS